MVCVNPPVLRFLRVLVINFVVPISRAVCPDAQGQILWVVYGFFPSWVDVGVHSFSTLLIIGFYVGAVRREHQGLKEQLRTIWRIHSVGDLIIQDRQQSDAARPILADPPGANGGTDGGDGDLARTATAVRTAAVGDVLRGRDVLRGVVGEEES
eukprot:SAG22_NODE_19_length_32182_cov_39.206963_16_plen_154_part_00